MERRHFCSYRARATNSGVPLCGVVRRSSAETHRKDKRIEHSKDSARGQTVQSAQESDCWKQTDSIGDYIKGDGRTGFLSFLLVCRVGSFPAVLETRHLPTEDNLNSGFHSANTSAASESGHY